MTCYHPIKGYRARDGSLTFSKKQSTGIKQEAACGQCIGCRLARSGAWALRCIHEASLYEDNCFITLTYDDENLPHDGSLLKSDFQKFMKRLRKQNEHKIRYYQCGEYGEQFGRPHYHACLFNHDFKDFEPYQENEQGDIVFTSEALSNTWGKGFTTVAPLTYETAAYTARYILKKILGDRAGEHYLKTNPITGEVHEVEPEYNTMSRRPGIGIEWYEKHKTDCHPSDFITHKGKKYPIPIYYDTLLKRSSPEDLERIKDLRKQKLGKHKKDLTPERLAVREKVKKAQINQLNRTLT
ncbi:replication initiator protein [Microviridae sp.]|nr:replication initiator protein [Microviridae sp.]